MYLVQVLLPLYDNRGHRFSHPEFGSIRAELTAKFGGATAYMRAPAEGTWEDSAGHVHHDDVFVMEVMTESLDREWWSAYRIGLTARFRQIEVVVRALPMTTL